MLKKEKHIIRFISAILVFSFFMSDICYAAPDLSAFTASALKPIQIITQDVSRFEAPLESCSLQEFHQGEKDKPLIIHIQDAHNNYSGQQNLAATLEYLIKKYGLSTVLVEGSAIDSTLTPVREIVPPVECKRVSKSLLMDGQIAGEEYLNLTTNLDFKILGVEDQELYLESLHSYAKLADKRADILDYLKKIQAALSKVKNKLYPKELLVYEKSTLCHPREGGDQQPTADSRLRGNDSVQLLFSLAEQAKLDLVSFPNLQKLKVLKTKERDIDFTRANLEQARIIEEISSRPGGGDFAREIQRIAQSKNSKASQFSLFQNILNMAKEKNVSLESYPNLVLYGEYLKEFSQIELDKVIEEMQKAEDQVYKKILAQSDLSFPRRRESVSNVDPRLRGDDKSLVSKITEYSEGRLESDSIGAGRVAPDGAPRFFSRRITRKNIGAGRRQDPPGSIDALLIRSIDRYLNLLDTAYRIQMTTRDFRTFQANEPDFSTAAYLAFINRKLAENGYFQDLLPLKNILEDGKKALIDFYTSVSDRDEAFIWNTKRILGSALSVKRQAVGSAVSVKRQAVKNDEGFNAYRLTLNADPSLQVAVLISGGYHTRHLKQLFQKEGYSYVVLTPIVTQETNQAKYEKNLLSGIRKEVKKVEVTDEKKMKSSLSSLERDLMMSRKSKDGIKSASVVARLAMGWNNPVPALLSGADEDAAKTVAARIADRPFNPKYPESADGVQGARVAEPVSGVSVIRSNQNESKSLTGEGLFQNTNPVVLEIGAGQGDVNANFAKEQPINYVLLDPIYKDSDEIIVEHINGILGLAPAGRMKLMPGNRPDDLSAFVDGLFESVQIILPQVNGEDSLFVKTAEDLDKVMAKVRPGGHFIVFSENKDYVEGLKVAAMKLEQRFVGQPTLVSLSEDELEAQMISTGKDLGSYPDVHDWIYEIAQNSQYCRDIMRGREWSRGNGNPNVDSNFYYFAAQKNMEKLSTPAAGAGLLSVSTVFPSATKTKNQLVVAEGVRAATSGARMGTEQEIPSELTALAKIKNVPSTFFEKEKFKEYFSGLKKMEIDFEPDSDIDWHEHNSFSFGDLPEANISGARLPYWRIMPVATARMVEQQVDLDEKTALGRAGARVAEKSAADDQSELAKLKKLFSLTSSEALLEGILQPENLHRIWIAAADPNGPLSMGRNKYAGNKLGAIVTNEQKDLPAVFIGDLHGRIDVLWAILNKEIKGKRIVDMVLDQKCRLVSLGDRIHPKRPKENGEYSDETEDQRYNRYLKGTATEGALLLLNSLAPGCVVNLMGNYEQDQVSDQAASKSGELQAYMHERMLAGYAQTHPEFFKTADLNDIYRKIVLNLPLVAIIEISAFGDGQMYRLGAIHGFAPPADSSVMDIDKSLSGPISLIHNRYVEEMLWGRGFRKIHPSEVRNKKERVSQYCRENQLLGIVTGHVPPENFNPADYDELIINSRNEAAAVVAGDGRQIVLDAQNDSIVFLWIEPNQPLPSSLADLKGPNGGPAFIEINAEDEAPTRGMSTKAEKAGARMTGAQERINPILKAITPAQMAQTPPADTKILESAYRRWQAAEKKLEEIQSRLDRLTEDSEDFSRRGYRQSSGQMTSLYRLLRDQKSDADKAFLEYRSLWERSPGSDDAIPMIEQVKEEGKKEFVPFVELLSAEQPRFGFWSKIASLIGTLGIIATIFVMASNLKPTASIQTGKAQQNIHRQAENLGGEESPRRSDSGPLELFADLPPANTMTPQAEGSLRSEAGEDAVVATVEGGDIQPGQMFFNGVYNYLDKRGVLKRGNCLYVPQGKPTGKTTRMSMKVGPLAKGKSWRLVNTPDGQIQNVNCPDASVKIRFSGNGPSGDGLSVIALEDVPGDVLVTYEIAHMDRNGQFIFEGEAAGEAWLAREFKDMPVWVKEAIDPVKGAAVSEIDKVSNRLMSKYAMASLYWDTILANGTWMGLWGSKGDEFTGDCDVLAVLKYIIDRFGGFQAAVLRGYRYSEGNVLTVSGRHASNITQDPKTGEWITNEPTDAARRRAVERAGQPGANDAVVASALLDALTDPNPQVRLESLRALSKMGLRAQDGGLRTRLGVLALIRCAAGEKDASIRSAAANLLNRIDPDELKTLTTEACDRYIVQALSDDLAEVNRAALGMIKSGELYSMRVETIQAISSLAESADFRTSQAAVKLMGHGLLDSLMRASSKRILLAGLIQALNHPDRMTAMHAALAAGLYKGSVEPESSENLVKALGNPEGFIREIAAKLLRQIKPSTPEIQRALAGSLRDKNIKVGESAIRSLRNDTVKDPGALADLAKAANDHPSAEVRKGAVEALVQSGVQNPQIIAALIRSLSDPDSGVRQKNLEIILHRLKYSFPGDMLAPMFDILTGQNEEMKRMAQMGLGAVRTVDERFAGEVAKYAGNPDPKVRILCLQVLSKIPPSCFAAEEIMVRALTDTDSGVRAEAVKLLGNRSVFSGQIQNLAVSLAQNPDPEVRKIVVHILSGVTPGREVDTALARLTLDPDKGVAGDALEALGGGSVRQTDPDASPYLLKKLSMCGNDQALGDQVLGALDNLSRMTPEAYAAIAVKFSHDVKRPTSEVPGKKLLSEILLTQLTYQGTSQRNIEKLGAIVIGNLAAKGGLTPQDIGPQNNQEEVQRFGKALAEAFSLEGAANAEGTYRTVLLLFTTPHTREKLIAGIEAEIEGEDANKRLLGGFIELAVRRPDLRPGMIDYIREWLKDPVVGPFVHNRIIKIKEHEASKNAPGSGARAATEAALSEKEAAAVTAGARIAVSNPHPADLGLFVAPAQILNVPSAARLAKARTTAEVMADLSGYDRLNGRCGPLLKELMLSLEDNDHINLGRLTNPEDGKGVFYQSALLRLLLLSERPKNYRSEYGKAYLELEMLLYTLVRKGRGVMMAWVPTEFETYVNSLFDWKGGGLDSGKKILEKAGIDRRSAAAALLGGAVSVLSRNPDNNVVHDMRSFLGNTMSRVSPNNGHDLVLASESLALELERDTPDPSVLLDLTSPLMALAGLRKSWAVREAIAGDSQLAELIKVFQSKHGSQAVYEFWKSRNVVMGLEPKPRPLSDEAVAIRNHRASEKLLALIKEAGFITVELAAEGDAYRAMWSCFDRSPLTRSFFALFSDRENMLLPLEQTDVDSVFELWKKVPHAFVSSKENVDLKDDVAVRALRVYPEFGRLLMAYIRDQIGPVNIDWSRPRGGVRFKAVERTDVVSKGHPFHTLMADRSNLAELARITSIARMSFPFYFVPEHPLTSMTEYARENEFRIPLKYDNNGKPAVWLSPMSGSFKRHTLVVEDENGRVLEESEIKIQGRNERKTFTFFNDIRVFRFLRRLFGKSIPMEDVLAEAEIDDGSVVMYGEKLRPTASKPLKFLLLGLHQNRPRLEMLSKSSMETIATDPRFGQRYQGDAVLVWDDLAGSVIEFLAKCHAAGVLGKLAGNKTNDLHTGNFRFQIGGPAGSAWAYARAVDDFSSFRFASIALRKLAPARFRRTLESEKETLISSLMKMFPAGDRDARDGAIGRLNRVYETIYGETVKVSRKQPIYTDYEFGPIDQRAAAARMAGQPAVAGERPLSLLTEMINALIISTPMAFAAGAMFSLGGIGFSVYRDQVLTAGINFVILALCLDEAVKLTGWLIHRTGSPGSYNARDAAISSLMIVGTFASVFGLGASAIPWLAPLLLFAGFTAFGIRQVATRQSGVAANLLATGALMAAIAYLSMGGGVWFAVLSLMLDSLASQAVLGRLTYLGPFVTSIGQRVRGWIVLLWQAPAQPETGMEPAVRGAETKLAGSRMADHQIVRLDKISRNHAIAPREYGPAGARMTKKADAELPQSLKAWLQSADRDKMLLADFDRDRDAISIYFTMWDVLHGYPEDSLEWTAGRLLCAKMDEALESARQRNALLSKEQVQLFLDYVRDPSATAIFLTILHFYEVNIERYPDHPQVRLAVILIRKLNSMIQNARILGTKLIEGMGENTKKMAENFEAVEIYLDLLGIQNDRLFFDPDSPQSDPVYIQAKKFSDGLIRIISWGKVSDAQLIYFKDFIRDPAAWTVYWQLLDIQAGLNFNKANSDCAAAAALCVRLQTVLRARGNAEQAQLFNEEPAELVEARAFLENWLTPGARTAAQPPKITAGARGTPAPEKAGARLAPWTREEIPASSADLGRARAQGVLDAVRKLLADRQHRPSISDIVRLIEMGANEDDIKNAALAVDGCVNPNDGMELSYREMDALLPILQKMSQSIRIALEKDEDLIILMAARDMELPYDYLMITLPTELRERVKCLPASGVFWYLIQNQDVLKRQFMSPNQQKRFFGSFGLDLASLRSDKKRLILDSGFRGSVGESIHNILSALYGVDSGELKRCFPIEVIGRYLDNRRANAYANESGLFEVTPDFDPVEQLPKTTRLLTSIEGFNHASAEDLRTAEGRRYAVAVALQLLPKFHGVFESLSEEDEAGNRAAVPISEGPDSESINNSTDINYDRINRVAAILLQYRLAMNVLGKKAQVFPVSVRGQDTGKRVAARMAAGPRTLTGGAVTPGLTLIAGKEALGKLAAELDEVQSEASVEAVKVADSVVRAQVVPPVPVSLSADGPGNPFADSQAGSLMRLDAGAKINPYAAPLTRQPRAGYQPNSYSRWIISNALALFTTSLAACGFYFFYELFPDQAGSLAGPLSAWVGAAETALIVVVAGLSFGFSYLVYPVFEKYLRDRTVGPDGARMSDKQIDNALNAYKVEPDYFNSSDPVILAPVYNEGKTLLERIEDVRRGQYLHRVLFVDDASEDNSAEILEESGAQYISFRVNQQKEGAIASAVGILRQRYESLGRQFPQYFVSMDSDSNLASAMPGLSVIQSLNAALDEAKRQDYAAMGLRIRAQLKAGSSIDAKIQAVMWDIIYWMQRLTGHRAIPGGGVVYNTAAFERVMSLKSVIRAGFQGRPYAIKNAVKQLQMDLGPTFSGTVALTDVFDSLGGYYHQQRTWVRGFNQTRSAARNMLEYAGWLIFLPAALFSYAGFLLSVYRDRWVALIALIPYFVFVSSDLFNKIIFKRQTYSLAPAEVFLYAPYYYILHTVVLATSQMDSMITQIGQTLRRLIAKGNEEPLVGQGKSEDSIKQTAGDRQSAARLSNRPGSRARQEPLTGLFGARFSPSQAEKMAPQPEVVALPAGATAAGEEPVDLFAQEFGQLMKEWLTSVKDLKGSGKSLLDSIIEQYIRTRQAPGTKGDVLPMQFDAGIAGMQFERDGVVFLAPDPKDGSMQIIGRIDLEGYLPKTTAVAEPITLAKPVALATAESTPIFAPPVFSVGGDEAEMKETIAKFIEAAVLLRAYFAAAQPDTRTATVVKQMISEKMVKSQGQRKLMQACADMVARISKNKIVVQFIDEEGKPDQHMTSAKDPKVRFNTGFIASSDLFRKVEIVRNDASAVFTESAEPDQFFPWMVDIVIAAEAAQKKNRNQLDDALLTLLKSRLRDSSGRTLSTAEAAKDAYDEMARGAMPTRYKLMPVGRISTEMVLAVARIVSTAIAAAA